MTSPGGREVGRVNIKVVPDTSGFSRELLADLKAIESKVLLSVKTDLDGAGLAGSAQAAVLSAEAAAGKVTLKTDLDSRGAEVAAANLGRGISGILATAVALGPALVPVAAGLGAVFAAVSAPLAAASAGLGAFAIVAIPSIVKVTEASDELRKAQEKVTAATTDKARAKALREQEALLASLSPAQLAAVEGLDRLKGAFGDLQKQLAPQIFSAFNAGLGAMTAALPHISTLAGAVAPALQRIAESITVAFKGEEMRAFVDFLAARAPGALEGFARGLGNVFQGVAGLLQAFAPLTETITVGLGRMLESFSKVGESAGLRAFVDYAASVMPLVSSTLSAVGEAIGRIVVAMAPIGEFALGALRFFADAINAIPLPVLTGIIAALAGIAAAIVVANAALSVLSGVLAIVAVFTSPITLVVLAVAALAAAFIYAYRTSEQFRDTVNGVIEAVIPHALAAFEEMRSFVAQVWPQIRDIISTAIEAASAAITVAVGVVQALWAVFGENMLRSAQTTWENIKGVIDGFLKVIQGLLDIWAGIFTGDWSRVWEGVRSIVSGVTGIITGLLAQVFNVWRTAMESLFRAVVAIFRAGWDAAVSATAGAVASLIAFVVALPGRMGAALAALPGVLAGAARTAWESFRSATAGKVVEAITLVSGIRGRITGALGNLGGLLVSAGRELIGGLISGITGKLGALKSTMSNVASTVAGFLPGSPVKTGPLTTWNNGGAGKRLMEMLAGGIDSYGGQPVSAMAGVAGSLSSSLDAPGSSGSRAFTQADVVAAVQAQTAELKAALHQQVREQLTINRQGLA